MVEFDLLESRRKKLAALEAAGVVAFPSRFPVDGTLQQLSAAQHDRTAEELEEAPPAVRLAGRLIALREHGKSAFADIDDGSSKLQCHLRQKILGEDRFRAWLNLDLGDFVGVEGVLEAGGLHRACRTDRLGDRCSCGRGVPGGEEQRGVAVAACSSAVPGVEVLSMMAAFGAHLEGGAFVERVRAAALSA